MYYAINACVMQYLSAFIMVNAAFMQEMHEKIE